MNIVEVKPYIALNLLLALNPCCKNVPLVPIAVNIWANVRMGHKGDWCKKVVIHDSVHYKKTYTANLLRASKKQITIQASCLAATAMALQWFDCTPPHVKIVSYFLFSAKRNSNFCTYNMAVKVIGQNKIVQVKMVNH